MPQPKRLSQAAIAKATGVSRATVSLVLRGGQGASAETQAKVFAVAEKMGYRPNALVHSIRSGKSRTVGVLVPPYDSFWKDVCYGVHDRLIEADHMPLFLWDTEHHQQAREDYALKQIHRLLDRWVDCVILWPDFATFYALHLHEFERRNIPVVVIDHTLPDLATDIVGSDEPQIARLLLDHLAGSLGHRHILAVSGPAGLGWADDRCRALQANAGARSAGPTLHFLRLPYGKDVAAEIAATLRAHPEITAVIGTTDHLAKKAYRAARQLNYAVPARLSIAGVGNLVFSPLLTPPLTTIRQDGYAVGHKAAQTALERSAGILIGEPRRYAIAGELVVRESTAEAPQNE